jgi:hypothetical protein
MKLGTQRSEGTLHLSENDFHDSVSLLPINSLGDQLMYPNCASLCSLCEGKEGGKIGRLVLRPGTHVSTCITLALCAPLLSVSSVKSRGAHAARA